MMETSFAASNLPVGSSNADQFGEWAEQWPCSCDRQHMSAIKIHIQNVQMGKPSAATPPSHCAVHILFKCSSCKCEFDRTYEYEKHSKKSRWGCYKCLVGKEEKMSFRRGSNTVYERLERIFEDFNFNHPADDDYNVPGLNAVSWAHQFAEKLTAPTGQPILSISRLKSLLPKIVPLALGIITIVLLFLLLIYCKYVPSNQLCIIYHKYYFNNTDTSAVMTTIAKEAPLAIIFSLLAWILSLVFEQYGQSTTKSVLFSLILIALFNIPVGCFSGVVANASFFSIFYVAFKKLMKVRSEILAKMRIEIMEIAKEKGMPSSPEDLASIFDLADQRTAPLAYSEHFSSGAEQESP